MSSSLRNIYLYRETYMNTIKINEKEATNLKGEDLVGGK